MDSKVQRLLDLWKKPFSKVKSEHHPFNYPEQLKRQASFFSPGSQYHFILDMPTLKIEYVSTGIETILGIDSMNLRLESIVGRLEPEQKKSWPKKNQ